MSGKNDKNYLTFTVKERERTKGTLSKITLQNDLTGYIAGGATAGRDSLPLAYRPTFSGALSGGCACVFNGAVLRTLHSQVFAPGFIVVTEPGVLPRGAIVITF